jgi:Dyp-type peroxidase family
VAAFWRFVTDFAQGLSGRPGFQDVTADWLAAHLFGRWPSGAPVSRLSNHDDEALGVDRLANNNFGFAADAKAMPLAGQWRRGDWPEAPADPVGLICPMAAHIRKVNGREAAGDMGGRRASFDRRILRRGLPFGPRLSDPLGEDPAQGKRGLLFVSYQTSIQDQFEFLCSAWSSSAKRPRSPSGFDMVIGQNANPPDGRTRTCTIFGPDGTPVTVVTTKEFVIPTGGGYFFSPSISALQEVLSA